MWKLPVLGSNGRVALLCEVSALMIHGHCDLCMYIKILWGI